MGARSGLDFISLKMASRHHKWWLPWKGGVLLLPLIICLGRLRIASKYTSKYIFNLWHLRQLFGSVVRALDFYQGWPGSIPMTGGNSFSYASFLCYDFHVVRWGLVRDRTLLSRKWLHVIINDDFLEKGECYGPALLLSIICLGRLCVASKYKFNLWQLRQGVVSSAQWLVYWIFNRVRYPH